MEDRDLYKGLAIGLLAGGAIGVAVGLLFAPKSGAETRQIIREKFSGLKERAGDLKDRVTTAVRGNKGQEETE